MKLKFILAIFSVMITLVACVLETTEPEVAPTSDPISVSGAAATSDPGTAATSDPGTASGSAPVKQYVIINDSRIPQYESVSPVTIDPTARYTALIKTNVGNMDIELFPGQAPITVNNFIFLANDGFLGTCIVGIPERIIYYLSNLK